MKFEQLGQKTDSQGEISAQESELFMMAKMETADEKILEQFTLEQQKEIKEKQKILSSLAYYISKDFQIPIVLGLPTKECPSGWKWVKNMKDGTQFIQMNAHDLLTKPMDYLRFVTSHEGGHARISRFDFVDMTVYNERGFSFLLNAIEDPRDNNFVAANYPRFAEQMKLIYEQEEISEKETKKKASDMFGFQPRFMQAGFEYIRQWYRERTKQSADISAELPAEVRAVVKKTMESASGAWKTYPTKELADKGGVLSSGQKVDGEKMITEYAKQSYEIILEEIWPEYQKLVEKDLEDQKMSELLKDLQKEKQEREQGESGDEKGSKSGEKKDGEGKGGDGLPKELKDKLSPEEQKELEKAIDKAIEDSKKDAEKSEGQDTGKFKAIDIDSLSPELKKKIQDFLDSLPEEKKKELAEKAEKDLRDFEKEIEKEREGKLVENPEEREKRESAEKSEREKELEKDKDTEDADKKEKTDKKKELDEKKEAEEKRNKIIKDSEEMLERVRKSLKGQENEYQTEMKRLAPQINSLKEKLAEIFQERRKRGIKTGFEEGEEIDVERRLQEKAKGISIFESRAWRRTELPKEKDYAISLLVDLSGSMEGERIKEAFEATVLFTEVLNSLGIKTEILGFNDRLYEYQKFNDRLSGDIRKKIITMESRVHLSGSGYNDDGWAVTETAKRLQARKEKEKLLLVISDGEPVNSNRHDGPEYELGTVVEKIMREGEVKIVGLGLGRSGVDAVKQFYPKHLLANSAEQMIEKIGDLLLEVIKG